MELIPPPPKVRRRILSSPVSEDAYLEKIGRAYPTHAFLGRATLGCYVRQIALLVAMVRLQGLRPGDVRVLDWGAGKGHISYLLTEAGFRVVSCDVRSGNSDSAFAQATPILAENRLPVVPLDHPWKLPFESASFDLVVSFGVLEHVPNERESLGEIARVLKVGGVFFFCFLPYRFSWTQRLAHLRGDFYHPRLYGIGTLRRLLAPADLQLADVWHGQLLPKNHLPPQNWLERMDRALTDWTPLKYAATNLEGFAVRG